MSKLEELLKECCPDGVKFQKIDAIFVQINGMTAVTNKWAKEGNCLFIDYLNVYKNIKIDVSALNWATVKSLKQTVLQKGDVLFTSASEIPDECALASEIEDEIQPGIFMDDHLFGLRVKEEYKDLFVSGFLKYAFRTVEFRKQVNKTVRGVTRFYISKTDFMKLEVPVPPILVQQEIVRILDEFTEKIAELKDQLEAELEARKKQYEYYRELLMKIDEEAEWKTLPDISRNCDKQRKPVTKGKREAGKFPYYGASGIVDYVSNYIFDGDYLLVSEDGANLTARVTPIAFSISGKNWVNNHAHVLLFETDYMRKYVEIYLNSIDLSPFISGGAQPKLNQENLNKIQIPIFSIDKTKKIVEILDRFESATQNFNVGLSTEIEARQKQYEYYRDKLLTFKRKA